MAYVDRVGVEPLVFLAKEACNPYISQPVDPGFFTYPSAAGLSKLPMLLKYADQHIRLIATSI